MNSLNITKVKMAAGSVDNLKMEIDYEKSIDGIPYINLVEKKVKK